MTKTDAAFVAWKAGTLTADQMTETQRRDVWEQVLKETIALARKARQEKPPRTRKAKIVQLIARSASMPQPTFEQELTNLLNRFSQENTSNTPDFVLATFLLGCLETWNRAVADREAWYGRLASPPSWPLRKPTDPDTITKKEPA
jgi:hypothetical protein